MTTPLRWELPHGVHVAMSLAADGDLREAGARQQWCGRWDIPCPAVLRQVHGAAIVAPGADSGDGLIADGAGRAIGVFGSDCPPLAIATPSAIGVAHCGWRGTAAGIVANLARSLAAHAAGPAGGWTALVGPGVHPDDFEVDAPVLLARAWPSGSLRCGRPGHAWLDLPVAIAADCASAGIGRVLRTPVATSRDPRLRSHRRDGPGHPQLLVCWRQACAG